VSTIQLFLLAAILVPVFGFTVIGLFGQIDADTALERMRKTDDQLANNETASDTYFYADQSIKPDLYSQSAAAYMLQAGVTFYFIYYGYQYGIGNLIYLIAWAIGLLLFGGSATQLLVLRGNKTALPDLVAGHESDWWSRMIVAFLSILTFLAILYVEAVFVANMTAAVVGETKSDSRFVWWTIFTTLLASIYLYSAMGGQKKVILTDSYQLSTAYLGFAITLTFLVVRVSAKEPMTAFILACALVALYGTLVYFYIMKLKANVFGRSCVILSFIAAALAAFAAWANLTPTSPPLRNIGGLFSPFSDPLGGVTVLGFCMLNLLVQFGDYTNYQRNAALQIDKGLSVDEQKKVIRQSIQSVAVLSPISWTLAILLGMLLKIGGFPSEPGQFNEYTEFVKILRDEAVALNWGSFVALAALGVAISSIMMSTADSSIIAYLGAWCRDVLRMQTMTKNQMLIAAAIGFITIWAIAVVDSNLFGQKIWVTFNSVQAFILLLAIPAALRLYNINVSSALVNLSILLGFSFIIICTFSAVTDRFPPNVGAVLPLLAGIGVPLCILCVPVSRLVRKVLARS
jgi:hypothetical protein